MSVKVSFETDEPIKKIIDALADGGLKVSEFKLEARNYSEDVIAPTKDIGAEK